ncbi:MAG: NADPH:quinone oxidoreductase family protein [Sphingobium sp.]
MKIIEADSLESFDRYVVIEREIPSAGPGQVVVEVAACGMGYVDALVAVGGYQVKPQLPYTPGQEVSGRILAVGDGVATVAPGDRVMASAFGGGLAEFIVAPEQAVSKIPDTMFYAQAAGFKINYLTALHGLEDRAALKPGERLLVFGAAGGVGAAAIQIGRLLGAEVIAAASTSEKRGFAEKAGAHRVIDTQVEGWRDRIKEQCGGKGPDVIFDPVTGPLFKPAFLSLAWGGRHLVVGFVGGEIPKLPINLSLIKGASLIGVDIRQFMLFEPDRAACHVAKLLGWVAGGDLVVPVGHRFAFDAYREAMAFAMSGQPMGKAVIEVGRGDAV